MHAEAKAGLAKDPENSRDDLGKETKECDALRAKLAKLEDRYSTLRNELKASEK